MTTHYGDYEDERDLHQHWQAAKNATFVYHRHDTGCTSCTWDGATGTLQEAEARLYACTKRYEAGEMDDGYRPGATAFTRSLDNDADLRALGAER